MKARSERIRWPAGSDTRQESARPAQWAGSPTTLENPSKVVASPDPETPAGDGAGDGGGVLDAGAAVSEGLLVSGAGAGTVTTVLVMSLSPSVSVTRTVR